MQILISTSSKVESFQIGKEKLGQEGCPANENEVFIGRATYVFAKVFLKLKGFDEQFEVAYEDVEFAYRAKLAGAKFLFVREAQACHPWRSLRQGGKTGKQKL